MQEKKQNISPIKQRILQFVSTLGMSKRDFYAKIGVSRGTLESNTGITEDVVAKFIAKYPNISSEWLLTGQGDMFKTKCAQNEYAPDKQGYNTSSSSFKDTESTQYSNEKSDKRNSKVQQTSLQETINTKTMGSTGVVPTISDTPSAINILLNIIKEKDQKIEELLREIGNLKSEIDFLDGTRESEDEEDGEYDNEMGAGDASCADVG